MKRAIAPGGHEDRSNVGTFRFAPFTNETERILKDKEVHQK
jgi:hypothetical protein